MTMVYIMVMMQIRMDDVDADADNVDGHDADDVYSNR
mgnify:CR=1 FL=1